MCPYISLLGEQYPSFTFVMIIGVTFSFVALYIEARRQHTVTYNTLHWFWFFSLLGVGAGIRFIGFLFFSEEDALIQTAGETSILGGVIVLLLIDTIVYFWGKDQLTLFLISPLLLLHCFGKVACFMAGCCYGSPVSNECFLGINAQHTLSPLQQGYVHPTQIYEFIVYLVLFVSFILWRRFLEPFNDKRATFLLYISIYALIRCSIEFVRGDVLSAFGSITVGQILSLLLGIIAILQIIVRMRKTSV